MLTSQNRTYIAKTPGNRARRSRIGLRTLGIGFVILILILILVTISFAFVVPRIFKTPNLDSLLKDKPLQVTQIYSDKNELVGEFAVENRIPVSITKIPKDLQNAIVAVEDKNFYKHGGVDPMGILRAVWKNIESGRKSQGGSTIPQQLARILYLNREKAYTRKMKEILIALELSRKYSKSQILEMYLNRIYLGHGTYGVEAASNLYFGKSVEKCTLAECALLAGLPQLPEVYSPLKSIVKSKQRRGQVLDRMADEGYITKKQAQRAKLAPIVLSKRRENFFNSSYFVEQIRRQLIDDPNYGYSALYQEGLKIYTGMNPTYQKVARDVLRANLESFEKNQQVRINSIAKNRKYEIKTNANVYARIVKVITPRQLQVTVSGIPARVDDLPADSPYLKPENIIKPDNYIPVKIVNVGAQQQPVLKFISEPHVQGAIIVLDPRNGQIKAMVGGYNFEESEYNRAIQAYRQPGSAFKPIVYSAAIDNGFNPSDFLVDEPISFPAYQGKTWTPQNYDRKYRGRVTLRKALEESLNIPTVKLAQKLGIDRVIEYARKLGIQDTDTRKLNRDLTLALGSFEVSPLELAAAYSVFANSGKWFQPQLMRYIADSKGTKIDEFHTYSRDALDPQASYIITDMLKGVITRGTAANSVGQYYHQPAAGKTGTTNDYSDAWFIGYTPDIVVCTWVGYDQRKPLGFGMTGGVVAAPIWRDFMLRVSSDSSGLDFPVPEGVVFADICSASGKLATAQCYAAIDLLNNTGHKGAIRIIHDVYKAGMEPKEYCDSDHSIGTYIPDASGPDTESAPGEDLSSPTEKFVPQEPQEEPTPTMEDSGSSTEL